MIYTMAERRQRERRPSIIYRRFLNHGGCCLLMPVRRKDERTDGYFGAKKKSETALGCCRWLALRNRFLFLFLAIACTPLRSLYVVLFTRNTCFRKRCCTWRWSAYSFSLLLHIFLLALPCPCRARVTLLSVYTMVVVDTSWLSDDVHNLFTLYQPNEAAPFLCPLT